MIGWLRSLVLYKVLLVTTSYYSSNKFCLLENDGHWNLGGQDVQQILEDVATVSFT
jgi:hypothetical protein